MGIRSIFLEVWLFCDKQKDRQEGLFFNLSGTGREASCCRGKLCAREAKVHRRRVLGGLT